MADNSRRSFPDSLVPVVIRLANLAEARDAEAVVSLIDAYAREPLGGGIPLTAEAKHHLPSRLAAQPGVRVFLAEVSGRIVGLAVCLASFSTFHARPLWNLHDLTVHAEFRGQGIGGQLLSAIEREAIAAGCCKITLEVRADNPARRLYLRCGFDAGDPMTSASSFWTKRLG